MATIPWFVVPDGTGLWMQHMGVENIIGPVGKFGEAVSGSIVFGALPFGEVLTYMFLVLVTTFFVTSADSASLAVPMMTTGGKEHPSTINRVFWGAMIGIVTSILMIVGGVKALQSTAIITGGPFGLVYLVATIGLIKTLRN